METFIGGAIVGVAVATLAPSLVTGVVDVLRPIAKEVVKAGVVIYDSAADAVSGATESVKDLVDEARHEIEKSQKAAARTSK